MRKQVRLRVLALCAGVASVILGASTAPGIAATHPQVVMQTPLGEIVLELYLEDAPASAGNFLEYVDEELFQGAHFYRVVTLANQPSNDVKIEVIQGGLGFGEADRRPAIAQPARCRHRQERMSPVEAPAT